MRRTPGVTSRGSWLTATAGFCLALSLSAASRPAAADAQPPSDGGAEFDAPAFARLAPERRVAAVVAALRRRDQRMRNFSYDLTADGENVPFDKDQPSDPDRLLKTPTEHFGVRRKGAEYLFSGTTATPSQDFWSHWDGRVYRTLSIDRRTGERRAVISDAEQRGMYSVQANHAVGFRSVGITSVDLRSARSYPEPATLPECVEHFVRQQVPTRVDLQERAGRTLVRLRFLTNARLSHRAWWFDPGRDWLTVRYEQRELDAPAADDAAADDPDAPAGNINVLEVPDAARSGGLWVPTKVVCRYRLSNRDPGNVQTVRTYLFRDFTVGGVEDEALRVPFLAGTTVADGFAEVSYLLKAKFVLEPRPYFVASARKSLTAGADELGDALLANPPGDDAPPADAGRAAALSKVAARRASRAFAADPLRGKPPPPFPTGARWVNGGPLTWEDLRGKVVVLVVFAGWQAPSRLDLRATGEMARTRPGVVVLGVHPGNADPARVDALAREFDLHYSIVIDAPAVPFGALGTLCNALGVRDVPQAVVVDDAGHVVARGKVWDAWPVAEQISASRAPVP